MMCQDIEGAVNLVLDEFLQIIKANTATTFDESDYIDCNVKSFRNEKFQSVLSKITPQDTITQ